MIPSVGRIVHYALNQFDAEQINRRRTTSHSIGARIEAEKWPLGAQAHMGNTVKAGDVFPMMIVAVWDGDKAHETSAVQGQVFLDGNDVLWAPSRVQATGDDKQGRWFAPPRV